MIIGGIQVLVIGLKIIKIFSIHSILLFHQQITDVDLLNPMSSYFMGSLDTIRIMSLSIYNLDTVRVMSLSIYNSDTVRVMSLSIYNLDAVRIWYLSIYNLDTVRKWSKVNRLFCSYSCPPKIWRTFVELFSQWGTCISKVIVF
jgi:hypothetical protein